ncbi:MAG: hypothetical protein K2J13_00370, partial [Clostridia bacterium]|nr:hypothetical protein [Clostridia bacterium]
METIGGGALDLSLTLYTHDNVMDLQRLINNVLANLGKRLEIPINLNLDDWQTDVKLLLQWDIDLNSSARSAIKLELQYRGKVLLGVYVYRNNLVLDLEGLGLFSAKLVNTDIVGKVFEMLRGYVSTIEGMDLNQIIGDLLKDLDLPTLPGAGSTEGDVATDDNVSTIGENLEVMDLVKYILRAVSIKDTGIALDFTSELINSLLYELLGLNLGIDITVDGDLDLFSQKIEDMFNLNVGVEDIKVEAKIGFGIGKYENVVQPDGTTQRVNKYAITIAKYDSIPEWDASAGRVLARTMLDNLDLGLMIDIANNTKDANDYYYYNKNDPGFLRIRVWKSDGFDRLTGVKGNPRVTAGAIIAGIYAIDKAKYNNNNEGVEDAIAYITIDYTLESKQMQLNICSNIAKILTFDIGELVGTVGIDLDLLGTLGGMLEGVFSSIDDMF